tara:strand:- start:386 stop:751 length:366 start_codon:yes stop_codon:yes gene_type:complete
MEMEKKMKFYKRKIPRKFTVGLNNKIIIKDLGDVQLLPNEQITFITKNKNRYDFCRKDWGYYATPSINHRLKNEGFKTALVKNSKNKIYVMVVDKKFISKFKKYCKLEKQKVLFWLDEFVD